MKHKKEILRLLESLIEYKLQIKIFTDFLPKFKTLNIKKHGLNYLVGNYKIPSTVSGRPTCSSPNLNNIPSGGTPLAKPIKECFVAREGYCIVGADFKAQELMANALITRDPTMLKEFSSGIDGHTLRAVRYFPEDLPKREVELLNYIHKYGDKKKYYIDNEGVITTEDD